MNNHARITKATAVDIAGKLSQRSKQCLSAMFISKRNFKLKSKKEYSRIVTELICAGVVRSDWDILSGSPIIVLQRGGRFVVDAIKRASIG